MLGETKICQNQPLRLPKFVVYRRDEIAPNDQTNRGTAVLMTRDMTHDEVELCTFVSWCRSR